jgi:hypothetical protein
MRLILTIYNLKIIEPKKYMENCFDEIIQSEKKIKKEISHATLFNQNNNEQCLTGQGQSNDDSCKSFDELSESSNESHGKDDDLHDKCLFEVNLNDMLRVFMEQNSQFEFLNRFYENSSDSFSDTISQELNNLKTCNNVENLNFMEFGEELDLIDLYYIYVWKTNITLISIAKNKNDAIKQVLDRYLIYKQQIKNKTKKIFCKIDNEYMHDDGYIKLKNLLIKSKLNIFPCKKFSCFF